MSPQRWPRGYVGKNHETIGSDLLAVKQSLQHLTGEERSLLHAKILGAQELTRLDRVEPDDWYPIAWLLELMEKLDEKIGRYGLIRMGRTLFRLSHQERVAREVRSGADVVRGIDAMYHHANRGDQIGGWRVLALDDEGAELEKTTPHHCAMEEGILSQALIAVGAPSVVSQTRCFRQGADACRFVIQSTGGRWLST